MAPHCYGKMIWILKYLEGKEPQEAVCSCHYRKNCMELTRSYAAKILTLPLWLKSIWKEERAKIETSKTICIHLSKGLPEVFKLDYPENLCKGYFEKYPETAIVLCSGGD